MTFLFLHGFLGGPESWRSVVSGARIERSSRCLVLPGHGPDPSPCGRGFDDAVARIAAGIHGGPHVLVGYSMGARLALALLCGWPEKFERAVLVGAHPGLQAAGERRARLAWERQMSTLLLAEGLPSFVSFWEGLPVLRPFAALPAGDVARRRSIRLGHTARGIAEALSVLGLGTMPSLWDRIRDVKVPVRLIAGAADEKYVAIGRQACAHDPRWTLEVVAGAAHDVGLEAPGAVIASVLGGDHEHEVDAR